MVQQTHPFSEGSVPKMDAKPKPTKHTRLSAVIASLALAALTLATFSMLREVGPESTVRKFHKEAVNGELAAAYRLSIHSSPDSVGQLASIVANIARNGGQFSIRGSERLPNGAMVVEVEYIFPNRMRQPFLWIVDHERPNAPWRVDADKTIQTLRMMMMR